MATSIRKNNLIRTQIKRAVMVGCHLTAAAYAGACLRPPPGVACGDGWCQDGKLCVSVAEDMSARQLTCVAAGVCGNGIIEADEQCDCGNSGIAALDAACTGQGNSATEGLCREDCTFRCGNGELDAGKICDTSLPVTSSCLDLGYDFGRPSCSMSCHEIIADTCGTWNWPLALSNTTQSLSGVWGSDEHNIFAVGSGGTIIHYDGTHWAPMKSKITKSLQGIWGSSPHDVFAVGLGGSVLHYDGITWQAMDSGTDADLAGVWGSGSDDIFAVSSTYASQPIDIQYVIHYNGRDWKHAFTSSLATGRFTLGRIWGSGPYDVFVAGREGVILHYDGTTWEQMDASAGLAPSQLHGLWGSGPGKVFAVGAGGTVMHYDGATWQAMASGTVADLSDVWGSGPSDVFAVGDSGTVLHFDGIRWHSMESGGNPALADVWGSASSNVFVVGRTGTVLHYTGSTWKPMDYGGSRALTAAWGSSSDNIFAVGGDVRHDDPYGNGADGGGQILYYNGHEWAPVELGVLPPLWGIWGCSPDDVLAVGGNHAGDNGTVVHHKGNEWAVMPGVDPMSTPLLSDVWGSSCGDVFAVGAQGAVLHYDGAAWVPMISGTKKWLTRVWGSGPNDVYAVGGDFSNSNDGIILHYDGDSWQEISWNAPLPSLTGIWGSGANDVFTVGYGGTMLHYDGHAWSAMDASSSATLWGVWGTGPDDVYAAGEHGTLLHYDGHGWLPMRSDTGASFYSIWGDHASNTLIISGSQGQLVNEGVIYQMTRSLP